MWHPLRLLTRWRRRDDDFSDEIAAHLALETDRLIAEGFSPRDAANEARRRFGNVTLVQERYHRRRTIAWLEALPQQLRRATRRLARKPVFTVTAVLTLMLGIGATAAVFSLVDGVLLRPLPFARPAELVDVSHTIVLQGASRVDQSDATYLYYRRANHVFTGVGAYQSTAVNVGGVDDAAHAARVEAARASASLFHVLGVAPIAGRAFTDGDDLPGSRPVAILAEPLWRSRFASDPNIVGSTITVDGVRHEVVGVMPANFAFPDDRTALWLPVEVDPARTESATFDLHVVARLRPGVTLRAAGADLDKLLPQVPQAFPGRLTADAIAVTHMHPLVRTLRETMVGGVSRALWVVFAAAGFLLLIACANVVNLFLVRAEERQHDLVIRRALGAGRGAMIAEFFFEGLLVSALGAVLGLALAYAGLGVLRSASSGFAIPRLASVGIDGTVLAVTAGIVVVAALAVSVAPALRVNRPRASLPPVQSSRTSTAARSRHRARRALVVVQVALALVLVAGAGLMARSFRQLRQVPAGFDSAGSVTFRVALPAASYPTTADAAGLVLRALDAMRALPGVSTAGVISKLPLDDEGRRDTAVFVEDRQLAMGQMPNIHQLVYVSPDAFRALGIPLIAGRTFERPDPARAPLEAVVTRALARRYWGDSAAIGRRLRMTPLGAAVTIVGVTGDVRGTRLDEAPDETVYLPLVTAPGPATADGGAGATRWMPRDLAFVVRTTGDPHTLVRPMERAFRALAPGIPIYSVTPIADIVTRSTARTSFTLQLLELASLAALLIGAVGLYGVMSYMVSLRVRDMAVRVALGAHPRTLRWRVLWQSVAVAAIGIAFGLAITVAVARFVTALLFQVAPTDPVTLLAAVIVMSGVAVAASWFPARRASTIDIAQALRPDV
ncbi:MAG TPA: ABC transporter permease [Gemmatimonadaceae bacterium]|nr:ABC transporter permease [Gemmatimonadaceae bacterium]